jgi:hypothetical protein
LALLFSFNEHIYYLDAEFPLPTSKEKAGYFVGNAENVGEALTFWILTEDTEQFIARSIVRTAEDAKKPNKRVDAMNARPSGSSKTVIGKKDLIPNVTLPSIDPDCIIGCTFTNDHAGTIQNAEIVSQINNDTHQVE